MNKEVRNYRRTKMQKEHIVETLREKGCRITKQRLMLIDIILEEECQSCKEIYYKAVKADAKIGTATVYRMVNTLEDACTVELDDDTIYHLSAKKWNAVVREGLKVCGYMDTQNIRAVTVRQCECAGEFS